MRLSVHSYPELCVKREGEERKEKEGGEGVWLEDEKVETIH